jgi:hemolysin type calcium-binding protein
MTPGVTVQAPSASAPAPPTPRTPSTVSKLHTITGSNRADHLIGTAAADLINGLGGNDSINGGKGNDTLNGGRGNDTIVGGSGRDTLIGGPGSDPISGQQPPMREAMNWRVRPGARDSTIRRSGFHALPWGLSEGPAPSTPHRRVACVANQRCVGRDACTMNVKAGARCGSAVLC